MSAWLMERLTDITVNDLQDALESVDEKTPALRLFAAFTFKNGIMQSELAEWFDVKERRSITGSLDSKPAISNQPC